MSTLHANPARGETVTDPARTAAVNAVRVSIEDPLHVTLAQVDNYLYADHGQIALIDAHNTLSEVCRPRDALAQLNPPVRETRHFADSLKGARELG